MANDSNMLSLEVATPLGMALSVQSDSIQVPSVQGEFGVLHGHLPLLGALSPGILKYRDGDSLIAAAVGAGFVGAEATRVRLIAEFYARPEDVDAQEARKDLEAAQARLAAHTGDVNEQEYREAQRDLQWAMARLELVG